MGNPFAQAEAEKPNNKFIPYVTCWAIEQCNVKDTRCIDWRLLATAETNLFPHDIVHEFNTKAKHRHPEFPRDDLYYDEENKVLYRVTESRHYDKTRKKSEQKNERKSDDCPI